MIAFIRYINLNLSWIIECLFLRNVEPLNYFLKITFKLKTSKTLILALSMTTQITAKCENTEKIPIIINLYSDDVCLWGSWSHMLDLLTLLRREITFVTSHWLPTQQRKVREESRVCHNHKPQSFPDTKRKRKPNKRKSNKRTKSTKNSSLFPKRGYSNAKRTEKH